MPRFNPWIGCAKVSPACAHCYAEPLSARMGLSVWGEDAVRKVTSPSNWAKPLAWNRQSLERGRKLFGGGEDERIRVFCASMADVFEGRPDLEEPRRRLFDLIEETPALDWLILTKRPDVARAWLYDFYRRRGSREWTTRDGLGWGVLPNVWIGTSIENSRWTWRADVLREIPATVRFISAEPLLGSLYEGSPPGEREWASEKFGSGRFRKWLDLDGIDWLIVGGESGGRASRPMRAEWARELRDDALERGTAFHFKQWGSHGADGAYRGPTPKAGGKLLDGADYCDFPVRGVIPV